MPSFSAGSGGFGDFLCDKLSGKAENAGESAWTEAEWFPSGTCAHPLIDSSPAPPLLTHTVPRTFQAPPHLRAFASACLLPGVLLLDSNMACLLISRLLLKSHPLCYAFLNHPI